MHEERPISDGQDGAMSFKGMLRHLAVALTGLVVAAGALAWALGPAIERLSHTFIDNLGLPGVFLGCMIADAAMIPKEPFLLAAYAAGVDFWTILAIGSSGAVTAGVIGWLLGRRLGRYAWVQDRFERHNIQALMDRYGFAFLVVAALMPFPYSVAVWAAGATGMPFPRFLVGVLFRVPKTLISLGVIAGGWGFGAWMHGV